MPGALAHLRLVELGGIGPAPHAAMLLADLGADVVRIERPTGGLALGDPARDTVLRGRRSVHADLRDARDLERVLGLLDHADVLIDAFRPGVTDRLGLGPDALAARNPRLVYGRTTGWGADGPLHQRAGHDINYLSVTGVLNAIGPAEHPTVPLNVVGDYGGGSLFLVVGILAALAEREVSGRGQVVGAAIVDGVVNLAQLIWSMRGQGLWQDRRRANLLDGGAPFYDTYACVTPVLTFDEAADHPHLAARGSIVDIDGLQQAAPTPRLSRTPATGGRPPEPGSSELAEVLRDWT